MFQAFVDPNCNVKKALDRYLKPGIDDVAARYKVSFQNLSGLSVDETLYAKIDKFDEFAGLSLKRIKSLIDQLKAYTKIEGNTITSEMCFYSELKSLEQAILTGNYSEDNTKGLNTDFVVMMNELAKLVWRIYVTNLISRDQPRDRCKC